MASALIQPPPIEAFGAVAAVAGLINVTAGRRSVARWVTVGLRHWRERTTPDLTASTGTTRTWALYPRQGTMQDPALRAAFYAKFGQALDFVAGRARTAGIQVHVTHHADVDGDTTHTQTISVHIPRGVVGYPERVMATLESEFSALGSLTAVTSEDTRPPGVVSKAPGWVELDDGWHASTARITRWPAETGGDLMTQLALGDRVDEHSDRSLSVLYRPLPIRQSRRSAKWSEAAGQAFTNDKVTQAAHAESSDATHGALIDGATLVDVDAYLTVWGTSPETVTEARLDADLVADRLRIGLDWLPGQQHRAHVMTTPHGVSTKKGAIV
ncbi:hypothetical protein [Streptomyces sp. NPDC087298]|uniref:hypothetical protein n=1 Tax=Streptomyces sp. NPDC087298 TaxID=3365779 RepID=UPI003829B1A5